MKLRVALASVLFASASAALAQTPVPLTISGTEASGIISLPGGFGADLTLSFEQVVGFNPASLEVTAALVTPTDVTLLSRFPSSISIPAAFPVKLTIEPSAESALSFSGTYRISLHTHNLPFGQVPFVLYSASGGGAFRDITSSVGMGSLREEGGGGGFSEFLIVADTRPIDVIIAGKFDQVQQTLDDNESAIDPAVLQALQNHLTNARTKWQLGQTTAAAGAANSFGNVVKAKSGAAIPDVWRAHDTLVNVAGVLRAGADTLKFSLNVKANRSP